MTNFKNVFCRIRKFFQLLCSETHYYLERCDKCHWRKAVWYYAPGHSIRCDECVPRGCSCNQEEDGTEQLDEKGRKVPCCEWMGLGD